MDKAVAIVSGGLDSTVLAYWLKGHNVQRKITDAVRGEMALHLISFDYGQRHKRELEFAAKTATRLRAEWTRVDLLGVAKLFQGSALTDSRVAVPHGHYAADTMKATIVPNRNAIMLAIAYAAAVSDGAQIVATAVHAGDHAIYPDCRPEFLEAFDRAERLANAWAPRISLIAPFVHQSKAQIVVMGHALRVPFEETWSCYEGGRIHCGACGTCVERREAFKLAGVQDPTEYAAEPEFEAPPSRLAGSPGH